MADQEPGAVGAPAKAAEAVEPETARALAVFDPIKTILADIESRHKNVVYDLTNTKDNDAARSARKELVTVRTSADKAYTQWNQPVLSAQAAARTARDGIKAAVKVLEDPLDEQITRDEERRAAEKTAREAAEADRIAAIRRRIFGIMQVPLSMTLAGSAEIVATISSLTHSVTTADIFGELADEANDARLTAIASLDAILLAANAREFREAEHAAQIAEAKRAAEQAAVDAEAERARQVAAAQAAADAQAAAAQIEKDQLAKQQSDLFEAQKKLAEDAAVTAANLARQQAALDAATEVLNERQRVTDAAAAKVLEDAEEAAADARIKAANVELEAANAAAAEQARIDSTAAIAPESAPFDGPYVGEPLDARAHSTQLLDTSAKLLPAPQPDDLTLLHFIADSYSIDIRVALEWLEAVDLQGLRQEVTA